jgi:chorismate dehydratase
MDRYKISIVNYTNTLPFRYGLKKSGFINSIDLQEDIPSVCAQKLIEGKVDIGLIPVAVIPQLKESHIISRYCLGSNRKVDTVKLYSGVPLEKIKRIYLDYQSRTSVALAQILSRSYWNLNVEFIPASEGFEKSVNGTDAAVVIGDRCFVMNGNFAYEYDLAEEWKKFTGLPFVFAAWVSNKKPDDGFIAEFEQALEYGVSHIGQAVAENIPAGRQSAITTYLTERINYDFDSEKRKALDKFLHLLKESGAQKPV